jgi:antitoxin component YwqK of YwqJK toxin-antitoxin module/Tfp pilus assembly protein PilF
MKKAFILILLALTCRTSINAQQTRLIDSRALIDQGRQFYDSGEYKKALELYNQVDRNDTNYVWSLYERVLACEADSQLEQGLQYCKEALALKSQREYEADLYNEYGNLLNNREQYQAALSVFDEGLKKYPSYPLLYFNKGITLISQERDADAELLFRQALMINPYLYSAHFFLSISMIKQGRIVPGMLSLMGYLLIAPSGKYSNRIINILDAIANSRDEMLGYKNSRTGGAGAAYETVEEIIFSKIALEKEYKPLTALDDPIARQIQVLLEKLEYNGQDTDFCMQYYVPFFKRLYTDGRFELLINRLFSKVDIQAIRNYNKKHKKEMQDLVSDAASYFNEIRSTRELMYGKRKTYKSQYLFTDEELEGKGEASGKMAIGPWTFYYPQGNLRATAQFDDKGNRTGEWTFYYYHEQLKGKEHYANGKLEGEQLYYFDNGAESSREHYVNGEPDGPYISCYRTGTPMIIMQYKAGKPDGEKREFYPNGTIHFINHFSNGIHTGISQSYYRNGQLSETAAYEQDKLEGIYISWFEDGTLSSEGRFSKGNATGEWKYYYESGQLKIKRHFENDLEEGAYEEYYENGKLKSTWNNSKGKINGEAKYYDRDGKLYSTILFDKDIIQLARYFDKAGNSISTSERKNNLLTLETHGPDGARRSVLHYDEKGRLTGTATYFYASGKISETDEYTDGKMNGLSVTYYRNGKKKTETPMKDGKEDGYYTGYYSNGRISAEGWFREGTAEGTWLYYDELGNLNGRTSYLNGDMSGYKEDFLPNGKKSMEQRYFLGWPEDLTQFDSNGHVLLYDSFPRGTGHYLLLYPDGRKMVEGHYVNGFLNGPYYTYFFDGSPESIQYYKMGLNDSTYKNFHYGGTLSTEGRFEGGKKTGTWKSYNEKGRLTGTSTYRNDQLDGPELIYNEAGEKDFEIHYKNGQRDGPANKYDPDGTLAYSTRYEDGDMAAYTYADGSGKLLPETVLPRGSGSLKSYFADGKPSRECRLEDGQVNGRDVLYYHNGHLRLTDSSDHGINEGPWKEYYPNGTLKNDYFYLNDNLHGICREYDEKGALVKEVSMWNGVPHGTARYYSANGKPKQTRIYYYGKLLSVKNEE